MRLIRDLLAFKHVSVLLGAYSGLNLLSLLLLSGIYQECYANILGDRVGTGISQTAISGAGGAVIVFFMILLTTNAGIRWRNRMPVDACVLNTIESLGMSLVLLYLTPYSLTVVTVAVSFMVSGVVGVSTHIALHDWKLRAVRDYKLRRMDLKFLHDDTLQFVNLMTWASIIYLTGGVFVSLSGWVRTYEPGTVQATAAYNAILLFVVEIILVGVGIWLGWIGPHLNRLEDIRLELRKLDDKLQQDKEQSKSHLDRYQASAN